MDRSSKTESSVLKVITWVSSTLAIVFTVVFGINYLSIQNELERFQSKTDLLISNTEERVADFLDGAIPHSGDIRNYSGEPNGEIIAGVNTTPAEIGGEKVWKLNISTKAKSHVKGASSGRLIGYEYKYSKEIIQALSPLSSNFKYASVDISNTQYIDIPPNGVIVSPMAGVAITSNYTITSIHCKEIEAIHTWLVESDSIDIAFKPVFKTIQNEPVSNLFRVRFLSNSVFKCPLEE